jgi:hypothetical protein
VSRITDVITQANTQYVIYFLLAAYLESLDHLSMTLGLPAWVKRFPIHGLDDVDERLAFFLHTAKKMGNGASWEPAIVDEAADVFGAASRRLSLLEPEQRPAPAAYTATPTAERAHV